MPDDDRPLGDELLARIRQLESVPREANRELRTIIAEQGAEIEELQKTVTEQAGDIQRLSDKIEAAQADIAAIAEQVDAPREDDG